MPRVTVKVGDGRPLLDIASYARRGGDHADRLTPAEIAGISRTVRRAPEVMVKVLTRGNGDSAAVARHFGYIGRRGELAIEGDDGTQLSGRGIGKELVEDWDLDLDDHRRSADLSAGPGRWQPKLVHKLMFSMPPGTPAKAVLAAASDLLREEFGLKHRYAFVLHQDEPHPHVHAVVKAVSEQGVRLHIKKETLRHWRKEFARHLREQGVEANATERAVRGLTGSSTKDGIYRATQRGSSTFMQRRIALIAAALSKGGNAREPGKQDILKTRQAVVSGWSAVAQSLTRHGSPNMARDVSDFIHSMPPVLTERELLVQALRQRARAQEATR